MSWLFPNVVTIDAGYGFSFSLSDQLISSPNVHIESLPWWQRTGAIILSSIPLLILAFGLNHLRLLFVSYGRQEYFSLKAAEHLGKVGRSIALWILSNLLCEPLLGIWLTMRKPVGQRFMTLSFSAQDLVALFLAACIILISEILKKAGELNIEHQQFV